jgi:hypothetical protein
MNPKVASIEDKYVGIQRETARPCQSGARNQNAFHSTLETPRIPKARPAKLAQVPGKDVYGLDSSISDAFEVIFDSHSLACESHDY